MWVTTDPNVLESPVVVPLPGIPGSPQTMTTYVMNYKHLQLRIVDLLSHVGRGSDHTPIDGSSLNTHSLSSAPLSIKPTSHVWVTTDPNVVEFPIVVPLSGIPGSPQLITKKSPSNQLTFEC